MCKMRAMLRELHEELGIPGNYGKGGALAVFPEADSLVEVGPNLVGRMQRLTPEAAAAWAAMVSAAEADGVRLMIVSAVPSPSS